MATRKCGWILLGILFISVWVFGSVSAIQAEDLKSKLISTVTKVDIIVNDLNKVT